MTFFFIQLVHRSFSRIFFSPPFSLLLCSPQQKHRGVWAPPAQTPKDLCFAVTPPSCSSHRGRLRFPFPTEKQAKKTQQGTDRAESSVGVHPGAHRRAGAQGFTTQDPNPFYFTWLSSSSASEAAGRASPCGNAPAGLPCAAVSLTPAEIPGETEGNSRCSAVPRPPRCPSRFEAAARGRKKHRHAAEGAEMLLQARRGFFWRKGKR